jgi:hypothetical protein
MCQRKRVSVEASQDNVCVTRVYTDVCQQAVAMLVKSNRTFEIYSGEYTGSITVDFDNFQQET